MVNFIIPYGIELIQFNFYFATGVDFQNMTGSIQKDFYK
jgi:hypothetical protein